MTRTLHTAILKLHQCELAPYVADTSFCSRHRKTWGRGKMRPGSTLSVRTDCAAWRARSVGLALRVAGMRSTAMAATGRGDNKCLRLRGLSRMSSFWIPCLTLSCPDRALDYFLSGSFLFHLSGFPFYRHVWGIVSFLFLFLFINIPCQRVPLLLCSYIHFKKSFPSLPCRVFSTFEETRSLPLPATSNLSFASISPPCTHDPPR